MNFRTSLKIFKLCYLATMTVVSRGSHWSRLWCAFLRQRKLVNYVEMLPIEVSNMKFCLLCIWEKEAGDWFGAFEHCD